jgi:hypothetical protein
MAEWGAFFKANGQPHDVIELMDQDNSINDDIIDSIRTRDQSFFQFKKSGHKKTP